MYVQRGKESEIPLDRYFGGSTGVLLKAEATPEAKDRLGIGTLAVRNGKLVVACSKTGVATVRLSTQIGQTSVSREIALIVRERVAANNGWL